MPLTLLAFSGHDAILPDRDQRLPQDSHTDNIATLGGAKMLKVYVTDWCPICERTLGWMRENEIPFVSINIEYQPPVVLEKVIEANDGKDWRDIRIWRQMADDCFVQSGAVERRAGGHGGNQIRERRKK